MQGSARRVPRHRARAARIRIRSPGILEDIARTVHAIVQTSVGAIRLRLGKRLPSAQ